MRVSENHTFSFNSVVLFILISSLFLAFFSGFFPSFLFINVPQRIFSASSNLNEEKSPYSPSSAVNTSDSTEIKEGLFSSGSVQIKTATSKNIVSVQLSFSLSFFFSM